MDLDIFKRKAETRGYSCPPTENGFVIYKPISVSAEKGTVELTVQSSPLREKNGSDSMYLIISRFSNGTGPEITAATILCRTLEEMSLACAQVDLLTSDSMKSPFEEALTGENLKYHFRRSSWVKK